MMWKRTFLPLLFVAVVLILGNALKDDKEMPFRLRKLNMIWQKAQNKMSEQKLQTFRRLLEMQDKAEIRWKELKTSGGDDDGEMEAMLRLKFSRILEQFGLEDHFKDEGNEIKDNRAGAGVFSDKRLSELWESAKGKFSSEELSDLETEFQHHKDKLKEYKHLVDILKNQDSISENSVYSHDKIKDHEREKLHETLQDTHETLTKSFMRLKEKVTSDGKENEFVDQRVLELWEKAKQKFSGEELDSIKDELKHFDHKIRKHKYYVQEVEDSERLLQQGLEHRKEKHNSLVEKAKEHARWVKKMHSNLMDKVTRSEL
ncbi:alpha-2-macroglobulin receptor-associated protein-like [Acropora millepora]|uniref:alpha-2-macroglobulin receptor-associated protein-like n=1 Tax=Acropora millepora TaxID=45264 RepID=UPI0010FCA58F|nr:alpha-2-macroglobulin receptor-associated protein-like [Acropora millepora]